MPEYKNKFCMSLADNAHFEPMHSYRMEYSEDIEIFELASPADHSCVDV